MNESIVYSIIIPVFNEEEILNELFDRLTAVMDGIGEPYEVIFVDDGSNDASLAILKKICSENKEVWIINLSRNFGHQIAISAGLDFAHGKAMIAMDADLQDPPELIPEFIQKWKQSYEVIYAIRKRKENFFRKTAYKSFYKILNKISNIYIPEETGDFSLMDRRVVNAVNSARERNRFVRGIRSWVGFKQIGIEYERPSRVKGKVKYSLAKLINLALNGFFAFSWVPLRISSYLGFTVSTISFLLIIFGLYAKLVLKIQIVGWASMFVIVLFIGGIQLIILGIIGEYIGRIYEETKQRPLYVIKEIIE